MPDDVTMAHNIDRKFGMELFSHEMATEENHLSPSSFMLRGATAEEITTNC